MLTRLAGRDAAPGQDFLLALADDRGLLPPASLRVAGRGFDLADCACDRPGFQLLAHKLIEVSAAVPAVADPAALAPYTRPLPAYHDLAACRATILRHGLLPRSKPLARHILRAGFSNVALPHKARAPPLASPALTPASADACAPFFQYNAKLLARLVSAGSPLPSARAQALNAAALHDLRPAAPALALALSMEVLDAPPALLARLDALCQGAPCGRLSIVSDEAARVKIPVFALPVSPELRAALAAAGLRPRTDTLLCAWNFHRMPVLTDLLAARAEAPARLASERDTRRWLAAAAAAHPALAPLLPECSRQAAGLFRSARATPAQPALDFWFELARP